MRASLFRRFVLVAMLVGPALGAQGGGGAGGAAGAGGRGGGRGGRGGDSTRAGGARGAFRGNIDTTRARQLYVSTKREDFTPGAYDAQRAEKLRIDSIYEARSRGVMEYRKITYKSSVDGMEIPAYVFAPLVKRGDKGHPAMVWVHDGVHGSWRTMYFPFVREAVQRGYVIIAPEYRGTTGYGKELYDAFDYGGKEVDDAMDGFSYLATLPYVDTTRVGIMGWSHGGFIAAHALFRKNQPFKAGAAIVPVTNLFVRLARSGPAYERDFATTIGGMPHEKVQDYIDRSPVYAAANLKVPMLVHVATNDCDVYYTEDQQMVYTLRALHPDLVESKIYVDPPPGPEGCGHTFSRRVDPITLERQDTPEQIDSWNRTWTFFEWNLRKG
ncbi:MAG TPA: alpha/beta fold hydrolase [Gemmatimonadaceae bacterium]|nr:alpha/beta fold hydrolase [Gemmatimonadaceae bacterium]